jgi:hypothetical protein
VIDSTLEGYGRGPGTPPQRRHLAPVTVSAGTKTYWRSGREAYAPLTALATQLQSGA